MFELSLVFYFQVDRNLLIITSYENALRTAQNFLSMFLNKYVELFQVVLNLGNNSLQLDARPLESYPLIIKCGFLLAEEQMKWKAFFSRTAGSMDLNVCVGVGGMGRGDSAFRSYACSQWSFFVTVCLGFAWLTWYGSQLRVKIAYFFAVIN